MTKNRRKTEERLLEAVSEIVREEGFGALGVNAVAQHAGVSKMLIYRYFENYEGLLREWALANNFWTDASERMAGKLGSTGSGAYRDLLKELLLDQADTLRSDAMMREVLRWMIAEESEVGTQVMATVEKLGTDLSGSFREGIDTPLDVEATVSVLISGIYYLALMADRAPVFNGVDLHSEEGWQRLKASVGLMTDLLFDAAEKENRSTHSADNSTD